MRTPETFKFTTALECLAKQRELAVIGKPFSIKVLRGKEYSSGQPRPTTTYQIVTYPRQ